MQLARDDFGIAAFGRFTHGFREFLPGLGWNKDIFSNEFLIKWVDSRHFNNFIMLFFNRFGKMIDMFVYHAIIAVLHLRINKN